MSVIRTVPALTFSLTLLGAQIVHAGSPGGRVDALTLPKLTLQSCIQRTSCDDGTPVSLRRPELKCTICGQTFEPAAQPSGTVKQQVCDVLKFVPLVPLPASCRTESVQHAANESTSRL